jgi:UDP-3-O-[3-hydroxymyristoyl] glucosamine N-acyltransferase
MGNIKASDIAAYLNADLSGQDIMINSVSSLSNPKANSLVFSKKVFNYDGIDSLLVICTEAVREQCILQTKLSFIVVSNPRLVFAKVVQNFFLETPIPYIHPTAVVAENAKLHPSASIGAYCVVESGVSIGEGSVIKNHVVISGNVKIGKFCYIKSGAVIGEEGFGFDFEDDQTPVRLPHLGSVEIGDFVEIGSNATVARGTLDNTIVGKHTKIDDHVHIAHNCNIGINCVITACAALSGGVTLEGSNWIGPNSAIIQKIKIHENAFVGIGSVVTESIKTRSKVMGLSAMPLKSLVSLKRLIKM